MTVWSGTWVTERLGVGLEGDERLRSLLGLALRRNPRRAHLLVSNVLGKHVPQSPAVVYGAGHGLGARVRALLGDEEAARAVVVGYAETATGLGHSVADGVSLAPYLHSTRRPVEGVPRAGGFEESHSHATSHLLLPENPDLLAGPGPLILVDDEFSTGNTVLNTIRDLHERYPRDRYVIVALVDMRSPGDRGRLDSFAAEIGARVDLIALASGTLRLPDGVLAKGRALVAAHEPSAQPSASGRGAAVVGPGAPAADPGPGGAAPAGAPSGGETASGSRPAVATASDEGGRGPLTDAGSGPGPLPDPGSSPGGERLPASGSGPLPDAGSLPDPDPRPVAPDTRAAAATGPGPVTADVRAGAPAVPPRAAKVRPAEVRRVELEWPDGVPDGGRHGFLPGHRQRLEDALPAMARRLADAVGRGAGRVLVLGFEELMYAPLRLGTALEQVLDADVRYSTTTRSPVLAVDDPGYAIRTRIAFPAHDDPADGPGERYAYNVADAGFDVVVAVVDSVADTPGLHAPGGLLDRLAAHTPHLVLAVVPSHVPGPARTRPAPAPRTAPAPGRARTTSPAPAHTTSPAPAPRPVPEKVPMLPEPLRGPAFSSYAPEQVGWLLQDLSDVELEAPTEEREEAIQSGGAHYAESLPVEYQPSDEYQALFRRALDESAGRIARAVGVVTETVLAERSPRPVLVSLARAGTPVGVLMRRWARDRHGLDLPHYAVSIVRGRGIDANALRWLQRHHDPADVVFVDGWTGKGAITRELAAALDACEDLQGFDPSIAVLADPGGCVSTYGTREDFLIPSACLNSTVSGLISRTVLRADLVGPHDFHGAKFYRELAGSDVSNDFLDTVAARFDEVAAAVDTEVKELLAADRAPTWEGWAAVERISEEYGIHDVNLVKPGVGETTRVLLRRVPWKILARTGAGADLDHVRLLAAQRGVPVEEVGELPYSCVGLIHPRYTRGATGADGTAVTAP
ncbi:phosphoribosyltransferase domain-containing protein [Streptomyces sp. NPDC051018]|uniref:phosphoribosyltransferase domain-containing protein n=1 Tax=Streptomyces sp. NPDC051018 TaxID=3365639 RepID=UPI0037B03B01